MSATARVLALVVLVSGCGGPRPQEQTTAAGQRPAVTPALTVGQLALPTPSGASQPQLTASSTGSILSWLEQNGSMSMLRFAQRTGTAWSEPRTIAFGSDW